MDRDRPTWMDGYRSEQRCTDPQWVAVRTIPLGFRDRIFWDNKGVRPSIKLILYMY